MHLIQIPAHMTDFAWRDGADCLAESCAEECTVDQLKMMISRGERYLVRMDSDGATVGWGTFCINLLPNMRVLHITNLVAHKCNFERFFPELKAMAATLGCSRIRCSAKPGQAKIFKRKLMFKPVYLTLEVEV